MNRLALRHTSICCPGLRSLQPDQVAYAPPLLDATLPLAVYERYKLRQSAALIYINLPFTTRVMDAVAGSPRPGMS